jgi:phosphatidylserine decarboxylase
MLFSRKNILTKGKKPLYAAGKVLNASCGSASSVFARCLATSTNKTSALLRKVKNSGLKRAAYSTDAGNNGGIPGGPSGQLPLYRMSSLLSCDKLRGEGD